MKSKQMIASIILMLLIGFIMLFSSFYYYTNEKEISFEELLWNAQRVETEVNWSYDEGMNFIKNFSGVFVNTEINCNSGEKDYSNIQAHLDAFEPLGIISRLEIIFPDGTMLQSDGEARNVAEILSFQEIAKKGEHMSSRCNDISNPCDMVIRNYVPIVKDEETKAILCGVIDFSGLQKKLINQKSEEVQYFIIDGTNGEFLLDTWHDELGNISQFQNRESSGTRTARKFRSDLEDRKSGIMIFQSEKAGENFYGGYVPAEIANWIIMATKPESVVFAELKRMVIGFLIVGSLVVVIFSCYFFWMLLDTKKEKQESEKQLQNVTYLLEVEQELFSSELEPEKLSNALQKIADFVSAEYSFFLFANENKWENSRVWNRNANIEENVCNQLCDLVRRYFLEQGKDEKILISNIKEYFSECSESEQNILLSHVKNMMMVSVKGLHGEEMGILGCYNIEKRWMSTEPLEQIALSFSMALCHFEAYSSLKKWGRIDALTGLLNRNCFEMKMESGNVEGSVGCIYMDANGLHEINNHLGHKAGDEMLKKIADSLSNIFSHGVTYRIGGDEFVVLMENCSSQVFHEKVNLFCEKLSDADYSVSMGVTWEEGLVEVHRIVNIAEKEMQKNKKYYYENHNDRRQVRMLDEKLMEILIQKQDADIFLSVLRPLFLGVYFVDMREDRVRSLHIPPYFADILEQENGKYSRALRRYIEEIVQPDDREEVARFCEYDSIKEMIARGMVPEIYYKKVNGDRIRMKIIRYQGYTAENGETLWIFEKMEAEKNAVE